MTPIIQALLTALLSGLFSGAVIFGLAERRDRAEAQLKRYEDLYSEVSQWCEQADIYYQRSTALLSKDLDFKAFSLDQERSFAESQKHYFRVCMIIDMFAPELHRIKIPILEICDAALAKYNVAALKAVAKHPVENEDLQPVFDYVVKLHKAKIAALAAVAADGRGLALRPYQIPGLRSLKRRIRLP